MASSGAILRFGISPDDRGKAAGLGPVSENVAMNPGSAAAGLDAASGDPSPRLARTLPAASRVGITPDPDPVLHGALGRGCGPAGLARTAAHRAFRAGSPEAPMGATAAITARLQGLPLPFRAPGQPGSPVGPRLPQAAPVRLTRNPGASAKARPAFRHPGPGRSRHSRFQDQGRPNPPDPPASRPVRPGRWHCR